jgi:hypothetical protein
MSQYSLTIDGKADTTTMTFHVLNPADETVVAACPEATTALVDEVARAAPVRHGRHSRIRTVPPSCWRWLI